jgi:hypothetical protein
LLNSPELAASAAPRSAGRGAEQQCPPRGRDRWAGRIAPRGQPAPGSGHAPARRGTRVPEGCRETCPWCVDVVLYFFPDLLARKHAYQALLIEEFTFAGTVFGSLNLAVVSRGIFPGDRTA